MAEASTNDSARNSWIPFALLLGLPTVFIAGCLIRMNQIEQQRIHDATAAFEPVEKLGATFVHAPVPFGRYISYYVELSDTSHLCDKNITVLRSLNRLPSQNFLTVWIKTKQVTDASVPTLLQLRTLDGLDVTQSAISDEGIETLRDGLPDTNVIRRAD